MKLAEILKEQEELSEEQSSWLNKYAVDLELAKESFMIDTTGKIIPKVLKSISIDGYHQNNEKFPEYIKFGNVERFRIFDSSINTFEMLPEKLLTLSILTDSNIPSLKGISKYLKECKIIGINRNVKSGFLDLFNVRGLSSIVLKGMAYEKITEYQTLIRIMNNHLSSLERDVFECQSELLDNDLGSFC